MRSQFKLVVIVACALSALAGCPKQSSEEAPPGTPAPPTQAHPAPQVTSPGEPGAPGAVDAPPAAEVPEAPAAAADPALDGSLDKFTGFSGDDSEFAFSVYSEGAGFHLLHIVTGAEGKVKERFQLSDEGNLERARAYLEERRFSSKLGQVSGEKVSARVEGGKVVVTRGGRTLYQGDPFGAQDGIGAPASAAVAGTSPSGRKVAVKVDQQPVTEFGGITTYLVLDLEPAQ